MHYYPCVHYRLIEQNRLDHLKWSKSRHLVLRAVFYSRWLARQHQQRRIRRGRLRSLTVRFKKPRKFCISQCPSIIPRPDLLLSRLFIFWIIANRPWNALYRGWRPRWKQYVLPSGWYTFPSTSKLAMTWDHDISSSPKKVSLHTNDTLES